MIDVVLEGGKELERKLLALEKKTAKKVVRKAVREGLKPTHKAAKSNAKTMVGGNMGGLISKALVLRAFKKQKRGSYAMTVRTRSEKEGGPKEFVHITKDGKRQFIPAAIEWGHAKPGRGGKKGAPKDVPAIPFMRNASDANLKKGEKIFVREVKRGVERIGKHGG